MFLPADMRMLYAKVADSMAQVSVLGQSYLSDRKCSNIAREYERILQWDESKFDPKVYA